MGYGMKLASKLIANMIDRQIKNFIIKIALEIGTNNFVYYRRLYNNISEYQYTCCKHINCNPYKI